MITKKNLIAIVLTTLFLSSFISIIGSTRSVSNVKYDPWADLNDDGDVDIYDAILFANAFGGEGTPLNKTELLYNVNDTYASLLSRIDSLNSSLTDRDARIAALEADVATLNGTLVGMDTILGDLESNYSSLLGRIDALENRVAHPITFNQTSTVYAATTVTYWTDMVNLQVSVNLHETSNLLIMFSAEAYDYIDSFNSGDMYVRALVDGSPVVPSNITLTHNIGVTGWAFLESHTHQTTLGSYSYDSYAMAVAPGSHTVKMQFAVSAGTGVCNDCTLTLIALPI